MDNNQQQNVFRHLLDAHPRIRHQLQSLLGGLISDPSPSDSTAVGTSTTLASSSADLPPPPPYQSVAPDSSSARADGASSSSLLEPTHSMQGTSPPMPSDDAASGSVSSTPSDARDVEMTPPPEPSIPSSSTVSADPPRVSTPIRNSRRARVEDEENEDVRETSRQRMHSPSAHDEDHHFHPDMHEHARQHREQQEAREHQQQSQPSHNTPRDTPHINHIFYRIDLFPPTPGMAGPAAQQPERQPAVGQQPRPAFAPAEGGFVFNFPLSPNGVPVGGGEEGAGGPGGDFVHFLNDLFAQRMVPMGPIPWGMNEEEPEDPERAKRLISGLEEVPEGLIKRMERVASTSEQPLCAVCFERLLDDQEQGQSDEASKQPQESNPSHPIEVDADSGSPSPSSSSESTPEDRPLPKVVVLPCSHVFHTSCLKPWFTRPHRTTCPTCRFDIDPDSLTWVPPPRRARRARPPQPAAYQPQPQPQPQPAEPNDVPAPQTALVSPTPTPAAATPGVGIEGEAPSPQNRPRVTLDTPFYVVDLNMIIPVPPRREPPTTAAPSTDAPPDATPAAGPAFLEHPANTGSPQPSDRAPMPVFEQIFITGLPMRHSGPAATPATQTPQPQPQSQPQPHPQYAGPRVVPQPTPVSGTLLTSLLGLGRNGGGPLPMPPTLPVPQTHPPNAPGNTRLPGFNEFVAGIGEPQPLPQQTQGPPPDYGPLPPPPGAQPGPGGPFQAQLNDIAQNVAHSILRSMFSGFRPTGPGQATATAPPPPPPPGPIPFFIPPPGERTQRPPPPEKRQWTPPPPPGVTLRERIERKEREIGLRCSDISCGLGPSDEDPVPVVDVRSVRQVHIKPLPGNGEGEGKDRVCEHLFHPACLVSAERVAGWGGEDQKREVEGEEEVEVSCPVCRAVGCITRTDWDEGACALV